MNIRASFDSYILAGGQSSRFGSDKALYMVNGEPLLLRTVHVLRSVSATVSVVGNPDAYSKLGIRSLPDRWPGQGPLGGIITALIDSRKANSDSGWALVVACDMPHLSPEWLNYLAERAARSASDIVLPESERGLEPLCACYRVAAQKALEQQFESGIRKILSALERLQTEVIQRVDWQRFDTSGELFRNMNYPGDFTERQ